MKKSIHPWWNTYTLATILGTLLVVGIVEYFFALPSEYLHPTESVKIDIDRPTPTTPVVKEPVACTMEYAPVCGADGKTYSNACMANAADTIVASAGECKNNTTVTDGSGSVVITTPPLDTTSSSEDFSNTGVYQLYTNTNYKYSLALPKYAYYQGNRVSGGNHILSIGLNADEVVSLDTALVKVYFFAGSGVREPVEGIEKVIENGTIVIVGDGSTNPKIQKIIDTILASAK